MLQSPLASAVTQKFEKEPKGAELLPANDIPPMVPPVVELRLSAEQQTQFMPVVSTILTTTSPEALEFASLLSMSTPQLLQYYSPQALMLAEVPAVTTGRIIKGQPSLAKRVKRRPVQRAEGEKLGACPVTLCCDALRMGLKKSILNPPKIIHSITKSMAHNPAAKVLAAVLAATGSSTSLSSLIETRQQQSCCVQSVPLILSLFLKYWQVQLSESKLATVSEEALGKTVPRMVKIPQQQSILLIWSYHWLEAFVVSPGEEQNMYKYWLRASQSLAGSVQVQLGLQPVLFQVSALSAISKMGNWPLEAIKRLITNGTKDCFIQVASLQLAASLSHPTAKASQLLVFQLKLPSDVMKLVLLMSQVQLMVELGVRLWMSEQLYLYPPGLWIEISKLLFQSPQRLELMRQRWKSWLLSWGSISLSWKERPIGLGQAQLQVLVAPLTKSACASTLGQTRVSAVSSRTSRRGLACGLI